MILPKDDIAKAEKIATVAINKLIECDLGSKFALKKISAEKYFPQKRKLVDSQEAIRIQFFALRKESIKC